jgi:predicted dehydrogenase
MNKLRIGVLGVSNHFVKRVLLPVRDLQECTFSAIASRNPEKARQAAAKYQIPTHYSSYEELVACPEVDAVYIPLPNHMHAEWIKRSVDAGKPVLCEKPLCMNASEAAEVVRYVKAKGGFLMEAFMYKFHPLWKSARDIVQTNQIGNINYIQSAISYNNPSAKNIRNVLEYGGGGMMDIGCYAISIPRFMLNEEPQRAMGLVKRHEQFKTDELSSGILDFGNTHVTFTVGTLSQAHQVVDIVGSAGKITIPIPVNTYVDTPARMIVTNNIGTREVEFSPVDQYGLMFQEFAQCVLNGQLSPVDASDAVNNQKVLDAVMDSSKQNNWVVLAD